MVSLGVVYALLGVPFVVAWVAHRRVLRRFEAYDGQPNRFFASGFEAARVLVRRLGLRGVRVELARGRLADHYDPRGRVLRFSPEVAEGRSVASIGIVAHEVGHAHQDATGYPLLRLQQRLALYVEPWARWSGWFLVGGVLLGEVALVALAGVGLAGAVLVGALSVPVERDASRRAILALRETGIADELDLVGVGEVLSAASFTYLAGLAQKVGLFVAFLAVLQLLGWGL